MARTKAPKKQAERVKEEKIRIARAAAEATIRGVNPILQKEGLCDDLTSKFVVKEARRKDTRMVREYPAAEAEARLKELPEIPVRPVPPARKSTGVIDEPIKFPSTSRASDSESDSDDEASDDDDANEKKPTATPRKSEAAALVDSLSKKELKDLVPRRPKISSLKRSAPATPRGQGSSASTPKRVHLPPHLQARRELPGLSDAMLRQWFTKQSTRPAPTPRRTL